MQENIFKISFDDKNYCEINLIGGGILDLYLGGKRILYSGERPDGGNAFTHPCIPNFNIAKDMPNHGPARKEQWNKVDNNTINWTMNAIEGIYPAGIEATRIFEIKEKEILVTTIVKNNGEKELPTNIAEHNYFYCPKDEIKNVKVNGTFFHEKALEADAQFNPWQDENIIEIPNIGKLAFITSGYKAFAQWSQPKATFACVEPIEIMPPKPEEFHNSSPILKPNQIKEFKYNVRLT